jgi:hypothetical protein
MPSVALATCAALPDGWEDDRRPAGELRRLGVEVTFEVWDDAEVDWGRFDRVVLRSTWDYTRDRDAFVDWTRSLDRRLDNPPGLVAWNSDKCYLADLQAAGVATVPTSFVAPSDPAPQLGGEIVVKPAISAGARDTGRFSPATHADAHRLLDRLRAQDRVAMVQPYMNSVDERGETAIVFIDGSESHVLRKSVVLDPDQEAPLSDHELRAAAAMFREELVGAGDATEAERELATAVLEQLRERFGGVPLYARVDMLADAGGAPVLLELEAVEPSLYFEQAPGSAKRFAQAVMRRLSA